MRFGNAWCAGVVWMVVAVGGFGLLVAEEAERRLEEGVRRTRLLPPSEGNPRNSEGDFVRLKDGRVLFVYTHFTGGGSDHSQAHLAGRFSSDGGETWSEEDVVVLPNEGGMNVMSVSLLRLQSGEIGLFYLLKNSLEDCRPMMRVSSDEGKTWSEATDCSTSVGYYVVNNDRVVQLRSGRLVIPAARHNVPGGEWSSRAVALCFLSDDEGKTWRKSESELEGPEGSRTGLQEPGVVELKDGRLMMFSRTDQGSQFVSYSEDGGERWSAAEGSEIRSPVSPATIERIPKTGDLVLVWNNHAEVEERYRGKRTPFHIAISRDEGQTWENVKVLEADLDGWYCYTAIDFVGDRILLGHCAGNSEVGRLNLTQITVVDVEALYR